jgi:hypothetical protein
MSHRVTTKTSITNNDYAIAALAKAGFTHKSTGASKLEVRKGSSVGDLDLTTGEITGDTDRWKAGDFDLLSQAYAEEAYVSELRRQGASIQERTVDTEGNIVIVYQTTA